MKIFLMIMLTIPFALIRAEDNFAWGRAQSQDRYLELYGGYGDMNSLEGRVQETQNGSLISGGLDTSLVDLNIDSGSEVVSFGGQITGRWFSLLVDYRQSAVNASGTAQSEIRLSVDDLAFNGQQLDYLLIPVGSDYAVSADTTWLGFGLRLTPFTLNPKGNVRFTPWLHVGAQYIVSDFSIDAGSTGSVEVSGFENRTYAVNGNASGEAQLIVPEYGLGGEVRILFHEAEASGPEMVIYGTYKILDYDGALEDIGVEDDTFDNMTISYTFLEIGSNVYFPVSDSLDLLVGLYYEQVDSNTVLQSESNYQREVDLNYSMFGLRAGLRF
ncbi:hypothetical protein P0Y35_13415 [Kiritimatiellaeota bacterium B1221]|nr:hypothetical protein [Kiritimatiellaeota bacterium B1221]